MPRDKTDLYTYAEPDVELAPYQFIWEHHFPNFSKEEIFSPELLAKKLFHTVDIESLAKLQRFRDYVFNATRVGLVVNHGNSKLRGVRSLAEQAEVAKKYGGAETLSMHCQGKAFDVSMWSNHNSDQLAKMAITFGFTGVGVYPTFVHLDTRFSFDGVPVVWYR